MSLKPVIRRARADQDVQEAIEFYVGQNVPEVALVFVGAFEQTIIQIQSHPAIGSPRYAHALDLPGLRCCSCKRFPYLVFYIERQDYIDVWRILHRQRDIPAWLSGDDVENEAR